MMLRKSSSGSGRAGFLSRLPRPLDPMGSFKIKTGLLVVTALFFSSLMFWVTKQWMFRYALLSAMVVALVVTQLLAHGMTSPLRGMTIAAKSMARGDYSLRVQSTSRDEIGELARAFNQMSADLEAADRYRRELIGNVSHELRTPISALHAVLENIVDGIARPDPETLVLALKQTQRLGDLVTELLDLSRLEGGVVTLSRQNFRLEEFLQDAIAHIEYAERQVNLVVAVHPSDLEVNADISRLRQVITNLLDNATRHAPAGSTVWISSYEKNLGVVIDVQDEGPGIPAAERLKVFERFTQGGATGGGTGLGLAIARWAIELHGGSIAVVGDNPGCCMRIVLPRK
ncbi:MAG: ATP-binding protein [Mycobacteriaceae bacterium]